MGRLGTRTEHRCGSGEWRKVKCWWPRQRRRRCHVEAQRSQMHLTYGQHDMTHGVIHAPHAIKQRNMTQPKKNESQHHRWKKRNQNKPHCSLLTNAACSRPCSRNTRLERHRRRRCSAGAVSALLLAQSSQATPAGQLHQRQHFRSHLPVQALGGQEGGWCSTLGHQILAVALWPASGRGETPCLTHRRLPASSSNRCA